MPENYINIIDNLICCQGSRLMPPAMNSPLNAGNTLTRVHYRDISRKRALLCREPPEKIRSFGIRFPGIFRDRKKVFICISTVDKGGILFPQLDPHPHLKSAFHQNFQERGVWEAR